MTPRRQITLRVLEAAKDAQDDFVTAACRRVLLADRLGWKRHGDAADLRTVLAFAN